MSADKKQECKSIQADCEECSAEVVITVLYAPPFRDMSPLCPYCQFPLTKAMTTAEAVKELGIVVARLEESLREVGA